MRVTTVEKFSGEEFMHGCLELARLQREDNILDGRFEHVAGAILDRVLGDVRQPIGARIIHQLERGQMKSDAADEARTLHDTRIGMLLRSGAQLTINYDGSPESSPIHCVKHGYQEDSVTSVTASLDPRYIRNSSSQPSWLALETTRKRRFGSDITERYEVAVHQMPERLHIAIDWPESYVPSLEANIFEVAKD